jgi:hypothetical protein
MIESASDFWTFIGLFTAFGVVVLGAAWKIIYKKRSK